MTEQRRTTASDISEALTKRPLSPKQLAERGRNLPPIRLRADAPSLDVSETTPVNEALAELRNQGVGAIALRELDGEATALVLPVERYLDLVAKELWKSDQITLHPDGRTAPREDALEASYVEEANPGEGTWGRTP